MRYVDFVLFVTFVVPWYVWIRIRYDANGFDVA